MNASQELLDVVDADDRVVGKATRGEIHRRGLMHRATHILVFNARGEVFLQKRSMSKDSSPGLWDSSAAGHLDQGEDYDTCAVRELHEELGIRVGDPLERLFKIDATPESDHEFAWIYRCRHNGPLRLQPEEIDDGAWFDPTEVDAWLTRAPDEITSVFRLIWRRYREDSP